VTLLSFIVNFFLALQLFTHSVFFFFYIYIGSIFSRIEFNAASCHAVILKVVTISLK